MSRRLLCVAVGFSLVLSAALAHAAEWTQWRGPDRTNRSPDTGLLSDWEATPPKLMWTAEGLGEGYASVSVAGGKIYTSGNLPAGQAIVAINAADGSKAWESVLTEAPPKHGYQGSRTTPTIDGERLYVVTSNGQIVCLKSDTGEVLWRKSFSDEWQGKMMSGWGYSESPLVDGDRVICTPGGPEAMMVALDKITGEEIWKAAVPEYGKRGRDGAGYASISISNGAGVKQYVTLTGRGVIGIRAEDGKFLWGYDGTANGTANIPTPIISGDYVFSSTGYNTGSALLKLSKKEGSEEVTAEEVYFLNAKTLQNKHGGMVLVDGHVYCGHGNGLPICVNLESGKVIWGGDARGPGSGEAGVTYADGNIIFRYQDGTMALIAASPEGYKLKGTFKPEYQQGKSWSQPVVIGGHLYLREQDKLMCYNLSAASAE